MGNLGRIVCGLAAVLVATLAPAPALAHADDPSSPDPTVMDVVDSVLAANPAPVVAPPQAVQPELPPDAAQPAPPPQPTQPMPPSPGT